MHTPSLTSTADGAIALFARRPHLYAYLNERLVVLPEPYDIRAWVVDLRDPFHPTAQRYETWAEAEAARSQMIQTLLVESSEMERTA